MYVYSFREKRRVSFLYLMYLSCFSFRACVHSVKFQTRLCRMEGPYLYLVIYLFIFWPNQHLSNKGYKIHNILSEKRALRGYSGIQHITESSGLASIKETLVLTSVPPNWKWFLCSFRKEKPCRWSQALVLWKWYMDEGG